MELPSYCLNLRAATNTIRKPALSTCNPWEKPHTCAAARRKVGNIHGLRIKWRPFGKARSRRPLPSVILAPGQSEKIQQANKTMLRVFFHIKWKALIDSDTSPKAFFPLNTHSFTTCRPGASTKCLFILPSRSRYSLLSKDDDATSQVSVPQNLLQLGFTPTGFPIPLVFRRPYTILSALISLSSGLW